MIGNNGRGNYLAKRLGKTMLFGICRYLIDRTGIILFLFRHHCFWKKLSSFVINFTFVPAVVGIILCDFRSCRTCIFLVCTLPLFSTFLLPQSHIMAQMIQAGIRQVFASNFFDRFPFFPLIVSFILPRRYTSVWGDVIKYWWGSGWCPQRAWLKNGGRIVLENFSRCVYYFKNSNCFHSWWNIKCVFQPATFRISGSTGLYGIQ